MRYDEPRRVWTSLELGSYFLFLQEQIKDDNNKVTSHRKVGTITFRHITGSRSNCMRLLETVVDRIGPCLRKTSSQNEMFFRFSCQLGYTSRLEDAQDSGLSLSLFLSFSSCSLSFSLSFSLFYLKYHLEFVNLFFPLHVQVHKNMMCLCMCILACVRVRPCV